MSWTFYMRSRSSAKPGHSSLNGKPDDPRAAPIRALRQVLDTPLELPDDMAALLSRMK
jgi:hypothetical protein